MSYGLVGLYAIYLIFVGYRGNSSQLFSEISKDAKGFAAWALAIIALRAMYENQTLRPLVGPFASLAVLSFMLQNYTPVVAQVNQVTGLDLPTK